MSPSLRSRPRGRIRPLVLGLLLALGGAAGRSGRAAPARTTGADQAATADRLTGPSAPRGPAPTWTPRAG